MASRRDLTNAHRLVHLDLKRSPLKVDYLEKIFPLFKEWGATGVLIEWEDTFPYSGELAVIGSKNSDSKAYTEDDVDRIHQMADDIGLMVVPLVQTFGHLEFVLRHEKYAHLREERNYPSSICPSHPETFILITSLIDQIMSKVSKPLKFFHMGADEVWHMGVCNECKESDKHTIYLKHLKKVLTYFKEQYPNVRAIIWDDMLRPVPTQKLLDYCIEELTDIMVWFYEPEQYFNVPEDLWEKYHQVFGKVWIASAYKGTTGPSQILPILQHHISNHEQWLSLYNSRSSCLITGIALTGWSRYDHFATLCELMPTALPTLAICLKICMNGGFDRTIFKSVEASLGYSREQPLLLNPYPRPQTVAAKLSFPGWRIATGIERFANLAGKHAGVIHSDQVKTWLNPWQVKHNFTNPMQIQGLVNGLIELCEEWNVLEEYMTRHMTEAYYDPAIDEWLTTLVRPLKIEAKQLRDTGVRQLNLNTERLDRN